MLRKYTDLSNFKITFNPLTHPDRRWRRIFEDEYARVIFVGYRLHHLIDDKGIDTLKNESLKIANEIRNQKIQLNHNSIKERLEEMYCNINETFGRKEDINDEFIEYLLLYLKKEKQFNYQIKNEI